MPEQKKTELPSALAGSDALALLQRMERLKRLMGTTISPAPGKKETPLSPSRREDMITAAIPFLDQEYQREIYVIMRLMELRRVLESGVLEVREKQDLPPALRRQQMLRAMQSHLPEGEQKQLDMLLKMMAVGEIIKQEEKK